MDLSERKFKILQAIIDDYIQMATPVGSRTISKKYLGFSSATIRNEMSDLEEMGFLDSPHTSAGRIPSVKAYRLYVDHLMQMANLSPEDRQLLSVGFASRSRQVQDIIKTAARTLSDITHYTSIISLPQADELRIKLIQLVPVSESQALMVVVTNVGFTRDLIVPIPPNMDTDMLYSISRMLSAKLADRSLSDIIHICSEMSQQMVEAGDLFASLVAVLSDSENMHPIEDIALGGASNILNFPEYSDPEKAKSFLSVLETRDKLHQLLHQGKPLEFTIRIGPETGIEEMRDCSVVTATYSVGGDQHGSIGIIGPTRMDYSRVAAVLNYMGSSLSEILSNKNK